MSLTSVPTKLHSTDVQLTRLCFPGSLELSIFKFCPRVFFAELILSTLTNLLSLILSVCSTDSSTVTLTSKGLSCSLSVRRVLQCDSSTYLHSKEQCSTNLPPLLHHSLVATECSLSSLIPPPWGLPAPAACEKLYFGLIAFCGALSKWIKLLSLCVIPRRFLVYFYLPKFMTLLFS